MRIDKNEETVGIFANSKQESEDETIAMFGNANESSEIIKKENRKTPNKKIRYAAMIVVAVAVVGILGYFSLGKGGMLGQVADVVVYDDNDTSDNIVLEKEAPDSATLSYYDYMVANCPNKSDYIWETVDSVHGYQSAYQVNEDEVSAPYIIFEVDVQLGFNTISKEDFNTTVRILKDRLDVLESPYAIKYEKDIGGQYKVWVKTGTDRMGAPIFQMLAYRKDGKNYVIPTITSQDGSFNVFNVEDFSFKKRLSGEYDMFVTTKGTYLDSEIYKDYESKYNKFVEFMNSHIGENMYWVYGGTAFATLHIDKELISDFEKSNGFRFSELSFLNDRKPEKEESYLLKLLYVSLKGEQYPSDISIQNEYSLEFSDGANETDLGYHINTAVDESLRNTVTALHANSLCYTPAIVVTGSKMQIDIFYDESEFSDVEFAKLVKKIYESNTAISGAAYQDVYVTAKVISPEQGHSATKQEIHFCKEPSGVISLSYRESYASEELKMFMENDDLFVELQNNR